MDPVKLEKLETMNKYSKNMHRSPCLKNHESNNAVLVYILTALSCSLVLFSPFWYPSLESLFISFPNLISHLVSPKCLFIVSNLIVFVLVGESKLHTSKEATGEEYYHEYLNRSQGLKQQWSFISNCNIECKKLSTEVTTGSSSLNRRLKPIRKVESVEVKKVCSSKGLVVRSLSAEELSKRADDFIARVNRQRRIEAYSSC